MRLSSKSFFVQEVIKASGINNPRILDIGCGTARDIVPLVSRYPEMQYVGVEPNQHSFRKAQEALGSHKNVTLYNQLGYDAIPHIEDASFDIVMSLSALEHVKQRDRFIALSVRYAKQGGSIVHRYDLGHALHAQSLKEKIQVCIGNHIPALLPEHKFVSYVSEDAVKRSLEKAGCSMIRTTYHQSLSNYAIEKMAAQYEVLHGVLEDMYALEFTQSPSFESVKHEDRERIFLSVAVWARKNK